jgi:hypothetical protein
VSGRPPFEPTDKQREHVETLTGLMVPQETVARIIGIDKKTLRKYFRAELDNGAENTVANLKSVIYAAADKGSLRAASYLLDRMGAWPKPESAGTAQQQELKIHVVGGLAAVQQEPKPNGHDVAAEPEA